MSFTAVIPPRGRIVLAAWTALPCAALAPLFWRCGFGAGLCATLAALALPAGVWCRACSFAAVFTPGSLTVSAGILHVTVRRVPRAAACGTACFSTPLLRLAGCRLAALYTAGGTVWLPALPQADAARLAVWGAGAEAAP